MPSPFPGMDPYLEAPDIWPDFHNSLASEIRGELNRSLPAPYYARLEMRPELGIVEEDNSRQRIVPDVTVVRHPRSIIQSAGTVVHERPRREISTSTNVNIYTGLIRHYFIEIRDSVHGHKLITLIEILSPSNKRSGPDRQAYQRKQRDVLDSDANLVELDLLRTGDRVLPEPTLSQQVLQLAVLPDYLVLINRAWQRANGVQPYEVFASNLREELPCVPIPLKDGEPEVPLDLQYIMDRAYDAGPYRRGAINYSQPPEPPLSGPDAEWAEALLRDHVGPASPP